MNKDLILGLFCLLCGGISFLVAFRTRDIHSDLEEIAVLSKLCRVKEFLRMYNEGDDPEKYISNIDVVDFAGDLNFFIEE